MKCVYSRQSGFTAIELVAAITILMGMTAMIGMILARSDRLWRDTIESSRVRQAGRRTLDLLTRDLSQAITDAQFPFIIDAGTIIEGYRSDRLRLVTRLPESGLEGDHSRRAAVAVAVWVEPASTPDGRGAGTLMRAVHTNTNVLDLAAPDNLYWNQDWLEMEPRPSKEPLARHITAFRITAVGNIKGEPDPDSYDSRELLNDDRPPLFFDVFLELLSPAQSRMLMQLEPELRTRFIERNAIRFTARINIAGRRRLDGER